MSANSLIEWTTSTWNPVTGCSKISSGCAHCWAERMSKRLAGRYGYPKNDPFRVTLHPDRLELPVHWRKSHMIFVCSMGDLFHKDVPDDFIFRVLDVIERCPGHTFQLLTKRDQRLLEFSDQIERWPPNVWAGVTVESKENEKRVDSLRKVDAAVRFLSCEPLLEDLSGIDLTGIGWVIAGGESGPGARLVRPEWVHSLRDRCLEKNVPFFFKQWGGRSKKAGGREIDGKLWSQMPSTDAK